jgi:hypothetical protein
VGNAGGTQKPVGHVGDWVFIAFLHCLRAEMSLRCRQRFPGKERCLTTFWDFLQSVIQSPLSVVTLNAVRNKDDKVCSVTASC